MNEGKEQTAIRKLSVTVTILWLRFCIGAAIVLLALAPLIRAIRWW